MLDSPRNPFIQEVRRASLQGIPTAEGLVAADGPHLFSEALQGHWKLERVLATERARSRFATLFQQCSATVTECSERAIEAASTTEHSQGVLALLRPKVWSWPDLLRPASNGAAPLIVVLDSLQDPGNAGAIMRSAEAFGASGVVFLGGSVQAVNGKLLRASAGSVFRVPYLSPVDREEALGKLAAAGCRLFGLAARAGSNAAPAPSCDLFRADLCQSVALVVGNEGSGLSPLVAAKAQLLSIPTRGVESLNAAVACSIALFEASRQRARPEAPNGTV